MQGSFFQYNPIPVKIQSKYEYQTEQKNPLDDADLVDSTWLEGHMQEYLDLQKVKE